MLGLPFSAVASESTIANLVLGNALATMFIFSSAMRNPTGITRL